jgi:hypothetical protein
MSPNPPGTTPVAFPPRVLAPPARFDRSFLTSCRLSKSQGVEFDPIRVSKILEREGIRCVISGWHAASAWAGVPSAALPVEIIAPYFAQATACLRAAIDGATAVSCRKQHTHAELYYSWIQAGGKALVYVYQRKSPVVKRMSQSPRRIKGRNLYCCPAEASLVMRWVSLMDPSTDRLDRTQDAIYAYGIVANNPALDLAELRLLGDAVNRNGGRDLLKLVADAKAGKPIEL